MTKIAIFASGNGSNFEAVIRYFINSSIEFICVSDKKDAFVLKRAEKLNIKYFYVPFEQTYDFLLKNKFDLIVLAGYMRILPKKVLQLGKFINIHPSLLPEFKGKNAIERAFKSKVKNTGVTIHYVTEEVDSGEVIASKKIKLTPQMTLKELETKIHEIEHSLLPKTIEKLIRKYNILLIGSGAREHAFADKLLKSEYLNKLYLFGANDGFKDSGINLEAQNFEQLAQIARQNKIDFVLIGSETQLAQGIVDIFQKYAIPCIGSDKYWTQLESSKSFAKEFMKRNNIPCADYVIVQTEKDIKKIPFTYPYVIKADGLAAGKGVCIANNESEAKNIIKEYLNGKFKESSKKIVVEEFLAGEELSLISLWDGNTLKPFIPARDYKKLNPSINSPNTGGMGAVCPVETDKKLILDYTKILEKALRKEKAKFTGFIYSGLIITSEGIKVLEFNMRSGDPETQVLMLSLENDLVLLLKNTVEKNLKNTKLSFKKEKSICVVLASNGYPNTPETGNEITMPFSNDVNIYYAGVKKQKNKLYTAKGRVMSICNCGTDSINKVYDYVNKVEYKGKTFRSDIA
ncbi:MAG: phosphoribosylamine--glycine ligase [Candidatus Gastranaerophilales bacterium]|nr:phosphoribosylamine--glycine ligase [Candidatus Gastranaerophilales bacterium]